MWKSDSLFITHVSLWLKRTEKIVEWTVKAGIRKSDFVAVGYARRAVFWPILQENIWRAKVLKETDNFTKELQVYTDDMRTRVTDSQSKLNADEAGVLPFSFSSFSRPWCHLFFFFFLNPLTRLVSALAVFLLSRNLGLVLDWRLTAVKRQIIKICQTADVTRSNV